MILTSLIKSLRAQAQDNQGLDPISLVQYDPSVNFVYQESLDSSPQGTKKKYKMANNNIVPSSQILWQGETQIPGGGYTMNYPGGYLVLNSAFTSTSGQVFIDYNFQFFTDVSYTEFLNKAAGETSAGLSDPTLIQPGLVPALIEFGLYYFAISMSMRTAPDVQSSAGGLSVNATSPSRNYLAIAKAAKENAIMLRDEFYQGLGAKNFPAVSIGGVHVPREQPIR